jgi:hypothetical protein
VPVAVYCCVFPAATVELDGEIAIDCRVAAVTVVVVELVAPVRLALTVEVPTETALMRPAVTTASLELLEAHVACVVTSCVLPSE